MRNKPRIGVVVNGFPTLSESSVANKVVRLRAAGLDVAVITHHLRNDLPMFGDRADELSGDFVIPSPLAGGPLGFSRTAARMAARAPGRARTALASIDRTRPRDRIAAWARILPFFVHQFDVIHFEYSGLGIEYLEVLDLLRPARLWVSCRGTAELVTPYVKPDRAAQLGELFERVDRVHCVSEAMRRSLAKFGLDLGRSFVNHPAIDVATFQRRTPYSPRREGRLRIATTARLHWVKGVEYAITAVRELVDRGVDVSLDIAGTGPEEEPLRFAIHDQNLESRVFIRGRLRPAEVRELLETSHVYLQPSLSEGISNAALEAMAMELPIVTTDAGGMAEAVSHGAEGFVVPSRSSTELARALHMVHDDPELARALGRAARARVARDFSVERQTRVFIDEYQRGE